MFRSLEVLAFGKMLSILSISSIVSILSILKSREGSARQCASHLLQSAKICGFPVKAACESTPPIRVLIPIIRVFSQRRFPSEGSARQCAPHLLSSAVSSAKIF